MSVNYMGDSSIEYGNWLLDLQMKRDQILTDVSTTIDDANQQKDDLVSPALREDPKEKEIKKQEKIK